MKLKDVKDIIVGGLVIEVNSPNHDLINNGLLGHYLPANLEIGVRDDLPTQLQCNVLIHEITHAIANVYCEGLNLDEAQVSGISQGFYQVLTDNEDLMCFLLGDDDEEIDEPDEAIAKGMFLNGHSRDRGNKIVRAVAAAEAKAEAEISLDQEYDKVGIDQGGH
jgi:hypothetical protein